jgi:hypothetical protein
VDGFALEFDVGKLKVNDFLSAKSVNHVIKAAARGGLRITDQREKVHVDFFRVDLFGQLPEIDNKQGDKPDVVL